MKIYSLVVRGAILCVAVAGCVSTMSGAKPPEANNADAANLNYQLGARYYKNGKYELARDRLILATDLDPGLAIAYSTLALTYESLDNLRLATAAYENAVKAEPKNFEVQNRYAVFLCRQKNFVKAQRHFEKAMNHPENDNAEITVTNAGMCMLRKPDEARAEYYFREALNRKPNYGEALLQICLLKYKQEDYLSSRAFLQRYMSGNSTSAGILYLASKVEDMLDNDRGRTDFENQLLREFPTSDEARKVLGTN